MFRILLASTAAVIAFGSAAFAADLPQRTEPPVYMPPPPIFTWTGVYIGGQIGYQWGNMRTGAFLPVDRTGFLVNDPSVTPSGVVGGAHLGYNYQISQFVIGLEGDFEGTGVQRSAINPSATLSASSRIPIQGSVRGRVGYAWDRVLIYGTGGVAIGELRGSLTNLATGFTDSFSATRVGWTAGGGIEYAITNNWSVRAEYRYTDFGSLSNVDVNGVFFGGPFNLRQHMTDNAVRVGFSYLFNPPPPMAPPVVAKY